MSQERPDRLRRTEILYYRLFVPQRQHWIYLRRPPGEVRCQPENVVVAAFRLPYASAREAKAI